jgi:hypothetical protein
MLANASIQNTTPLQGLPHCAFRQLAGLRERFVVSPRLDPRFRGDDRGGLVDRSQNAGAVKFL